MTSREMMINILSEALLNACDIHSNIVPEQVVDYMIKKNTIVLPCNVGDTVFVLLSQEKEISKGEVSGFVIGAKHDIIKFKDGSIYTVWDKDYDACFGKTIFLSEEAAEEAKSKELYFSDLDRALDALREGVMNFTETFKKDCIEVMNFYKTVPYAVQAGYSTKEVLDNIKKEQ